MSERASHYQAYLLRFWRDGEQTTWRASLEDPHTGETFGFATMQHLYEFLDEKVLPPAGTPPTTTDSHPPTNKPTN